MLIGGQRDVFGLRIRGESMIEAGIHDGDYVFVRKQLEALAAKSSSRWSATKPPANTSSRSATTFASSPRIAP